MVIHSPLRPLAFNTMSACQITQPSMLQVQSGYHVVQCHIHCLVLVRTHPSRHTHTQTNTHRDTHTHTQTQTQTQTQRHRDTETRTRAQRTSDVLGGLRAPEINFSMLLLLPGTYDAKHPVNYLCCNVHRKRTEVPP